MIHQKRGGVYRQPFARTIHYPVPGIPANEKQRTAGIGFPDTGVFRSIRSASGRQYSSDSIHIDPGILDRICADGLRIVEIVIQYKIHEVTYSTTVETLRTHGQRVTTPAGWQIALPRHLWLIDGKSQPKPQVQQPEIEKQPEAAQLGLFGGAL